MDNDIIQTPVPDEAKRDEEQAYLARMRHSAAHLMAGAVLDLIPEAKLGIGPAIEDGFYYDFDLPRPLSQDDLGRIEERMHQAQAANSQYVYEPVTREQAMRLFADQPYKLELIRDLPQDAQLSIYSHDGFTDLCRGPHVHDTSEVGPFKLLHVAGAYWRGSEKNPMLQRIYGTAWRTQEDLDAYLHRLEEAERRDHRKLGKELDLFSIHEEAGAGLIYWHPKGALMRVLIEDVWRKEHLKADYDIVYSPHIGKSWLWETSGHLDFYRESMYDPMNLDGQEYYLKPMNCPFHILMYKTKRRSYRELPLRWAELGTVYRYERSGVLHGLLRVRGFTQDDGHIFCRPDQVEDEILRVLDFNMHIVGILGFHDFEIYLSTRPDKYVGALQNWDMAEDALRRALEARNLAYKVDEGGGAFYGPKIDMKIKDSLGRAWQCTTVQFDFNLPERFNMVYVGEDGQEHQPFMVHRALLGSIERFFGVLVEHYGGAFPFWLSPVQAVVIPISDVKHMDYAQSVVRRLKAKGLRAHLDDRRDRMGAKIRDAQLQKIPYMLIIGDKELESESVAVRLRSGEDLGAMKLDDLEARMMQENSYEL
jgi:threonyl-tRNA synthetase